MRSSSAWVLYCKFAGDLQSTFLEEHLRVTGSVFYNICFGASNNNTFYWLAFIIYRPEFGDWSKIFLKVFLFYNIFFKIIFQMLALPITFLFQSLVKLMFVVIVAVVPHRCFSREIVWSIPVINVKRNNFISNGQMSWGYFYIILFSFDENLNSPKYGA